MTTASRAAIALYCHPSSACAAVRALHVTVRAVEGRLTLSYELEAELEQLRIPAAEAPQRAHELWRHTCFEAFLAQSGASGYCELNFAPSRSWAMYRFSAHRQGMLAVTDARDPAITVRRTATELTLTATVYIQDFIARRLPVVVRMGLAAVLEDEDGRLSYWGARHPPGKPDFHHPDNFTLELGV
jgi:hypothetical protein